MMGLRENYKKNKLTLNSELNANEELEREMDDS